MYKIDILRHTLALLFENCCTRFFALRESDRAILWYNSWYEFEAHLRLPFDGRVGHGLIVAAEKLSWLIHYFVVTVPGLLDPDADDGRW